MTKNFQQEEFKCKCHCGEARISPTIVMLCQMVRDRFDVPVKVISGCRCEKHNSNVGGAKNSMHMPKEDELCHGADIQALGVNPKAVYDFLDTFFPNMLGLGLYGSWVHMDDRLDKKYRWKG